MNRAIENVGAEQRSTKTQTRKMLDYAVDEANHEGRVNALNLEKWTNAIEDSTKGTALFKS